MKDRRLKTFGLVAAALLLYSYTIYTIFFKEKAQNDIVEVSAKENTDDSLTLIALQEKVEKAIARKKNLKDYEPTSTDPFGGYQLLKLTRPKERDANEQARAPVQTQLRLLGVIWDDVKPYALVTHANGKTYDVNAGATVEGELILKITRDYIITEKEKVKFEITTSGFKKLGE